MAKKQGDRKQGQSSTMDLRIELDSLERQIDRLKIEYEQYFSGVLPFAPEKLHADVRRSIRRLMHAPFKSSEINFRMRSLESRFQTFNNYWQRVMKQREEGKYKRDLFKADLRERVAQEEAFAETSQGKAQKSMQSLFQSYKSALEKQTGKQQNLDYGAFEKSLVKRAKAFKKKHGAKKLSFKVVVKEGKVTLQAKAKKQEVGS